MKQYHRLTEAQKLQVLNQASAQLNIQQLYLEKDYWVCVVLGMLFNMPGMKQYLCFRGGTSLSKVFHCINRFFAAESLALPNAYLRKVPILRVGAKPPVVFHRCSCW